MNSTQPPTALASTLPGLPALAEQINREHTQAIDHAQRAIEHALACGRLLIEVKAELPHGEFLPWLAANCEVKQRQAQNYMRVANNWTAIEAKAHSGAHLTIEGALGLLDGPGQQPTLTGPLEVYRDAGLLNDGHLYQLDRFHTVLGDLEYHAKNAEPITDWDGVDAVVHYLASMRIEDVPLTWFGNLDGDKLDTVRRACIAHDLLLADGGYHINAGDRAAFWWGSFAAYVSANVEQLTDAITRWKERFYSAFGALLLLHTECPVGDCQSDYTSLRHGEWWGYHSDIRHAGAAAWLAPNEFGPERITLAFNTVMKSCSLPSIMQPWSPHFAEYKAMRERESRRERS